MVKLKIGWVGRGKECFRGSRTMGSGQVSKKPLQVVKIECRTGRDEVW